MRNGSKWISLALLIVLAAATASAQQAHPVDDKLLLNAGKTGDEWLMAAGNYSQTRYSPLKQIDASNVSRLGLAWYYDTGSLPGVLEASPVISNGTLYGTVTWGVVFAVDARTGKEKWRWDPQLGHQNFPPGSMGKPDSEKVRTGPSLCCGPGNRGVAVYGGKVYVGTLDARLVALDAETGKVVWDVATADKNSDYSITGAPLIVKGKVIIGNGGGEFAVRGYISAYDPETGKLDLALLHRAGRSIEAVREQSHGSRRENLVERYSVVEIGRRRQSLECDFLRSAARPALLRHWAGRPVGPEISQQAGQRRFVYLLDHRREAGDGQIRLVFPDHARR